jgi:hypothetical protein
MQTRVCFKRGTLRLDERIVKILVGVKDEEEEEDEDDDDDSDDEEEGDDNDDEGEGDDNDDGEGEDDDDDNDVEDGLLFFSKSSFSLFSSLEIKSYIVRLTETLC